MSEAVVGWDSRVLRHHHVNDGVSKQAIAERLKASRKPVTRWGQDGDLQRALEEPMIWFEPAEVGHHKDGH